uniref:RNA-dependent RNA polymerase n=1 Tax=Plasmopara viticola lesion associated mitovirus 31 TaxID=2719458 RepID=A0A6G9RWJ9_9VIRU|nr:RNA-dependent RNA polymerase [Plasmopara viticola lesion associated mitovirus 31]
MGFYSSWASFALIHHYIIYYCCKIVGKDWKSLDYCLLGDDIVIGDKDVGEAYLKVMVNLGVKISTAKSHISPNLYEFAKRLIYKGSEITPFPYSALKMAGRSNSALTVLLMEEERRGWSFPDSVSNSVSDYLGIVRSLPSRVKSKGEEQAFLTEHIIHIIWGTKPAGLCMTTLARRFTTLTNIITDQVSTNILANIMVELFSESNSALLKPGGKPLGLLAEAIVMLLTGSENPDALTLLKNPHLDCYGSIEQTYLDLLRKAREIDTIHQGEWPLFLKAITIPLSDELFQQRQTEVMRLGVSKVGKGLIERLKLLESYPGLLDM